MTSMLVLTALFAALLVYAYSRHNQSRAKPLKTSLVWNTFLPFLFLICTCAAHACTLRAPAPSTLTPLPL
jgi:hypothetical protein